MARDTKKNSAYDSGLRGGESPREYKRGKGKELTLPNGATNLMIRPAVNGFILECSYPPEKGDKFMSWTPPEPKVFTTASALAGFIEEELGVKDEDDKE